MKETLKQDLQSMVCIGNTAKLPTARLNNYPELRKTLIKACGKYKRNTFEFLYPAKVIINKLVSGVTIDFKKEFQFFTTPPQLAENMVDQFYFEKAVLDCLEPSGGHGVLIDALLNRNQITKNFDVIELSELNEAVLRDKYSHLGTQVMITKGDFLKIEFSKKYDLIIANPPFSKNQDIDHIKKMYSLLNDTGQLVTISSKSWFQGSQKKQVEFKHWLENDVCADLYDLDQGTFKSSGTNVSGMLIAIRK